MHKTLINNMHLRILQVLPALDMGGVETGTIELSRFLSDKNYKNYIASNGGKLIDHIDPVNTSHIQLPLHSKNPIHLILNIMHLVKIINQHKVNIIHARSRAPAWSAYFAAKITKIPFITTFHGSYNFSNSIKKFYNSVMVRGNYVITVSEYIHKHILTHYHAYVGKTKIVCIDRGVNLESFQNYTLQDHQKQFLQKRWKINSHYPTFIFPGRLTRWKGQLVALKALNILHKKSIKFNAVFLGSAQGRQSYLNQMELMIKEYDIQNCVVIDQHCPDVLGAYQLADIVVHTAIEPEAFGRVLTEAHAAKRLVIASGCGAPQDIIQNGVTGFLHQPHDWQDLADKIVAALNLTADDKKKIITNAFVKLQENYTNDIMFGKTLEVYYQALQNKS